MTLLNVWKFWTNQLWGRAPVSSLRRGRAASPAAPRPTARLKVRLGLWGEKVLPMWGKKTSSKLLTIRTLSAFTSHVEQRLSERSRVLGVYFCSSSQRNRSSMWNLVLITRACVNMNAEWWQTNLTSSFISSDASNYLTVNVVSDVRHDVTLLLLWRLILFRNCGSNWLAEIIMMMMSSEMWCVATASVSFKSPASSCYRAFIVW